MVTLSEAVTSEQGGEDCGCGEKGQAPERQMTVSIALNVSCFRVAARTCTSSLLCRPHTECSADCAHIPTYVTDSGFTPPVIDHCTINHRDRALFSTFIGSSVNFLSLAHVFCVRKHRHRDISKLAQCRTSRRRLREQPLRRVFRSD